MAKRGVAWSVVVSHDGAGGRWWFRVVVRWVVVVRGGWSGRGKG